MLDLGFDKLSTYNISENSERELGDIINRLIADGIIVKTDTEFPVLKLTASAAMVLKWMRKVNMKVKKTVVKTAVKTAPAKKLYNIDDSLFVRLKEVRLDRARIQSVPPFVIFADTSLIDMCKKLPVTDKEFLNVTGVGQLKLERYGEVFMEVIRTFVNNKNKKAGI